MNKAASTETASIVGRHRSRPVVVTHAEFLVSAYGKAHALQIAEVNSRIDGKESYWALVLEAIVEASDHA